MGNVLATIWLAINSSKSLTTAVSQKLFNHNHKAQKYLKTEALMDVIARRDLPERLARKVLLLVPLFFRFSIVVLVAIVR